MPSIDDRTGYLLNQYISGDCSRDEFEELVALLKIQTDTPVVENILMQAVQNSQYHVAEQEVDWEQILLQVRQQPAVAGTTPVRKFIWWRRMAVAAVFLIGIAGLGYWWFAKTKNIGTVKPSVPLVTDIMPGHNGAILTLQNGQQVMLDSTRNGALTMSSGLQIVKHDSVLTYALAGKQHDIVKAEMVYNTLVTPRGRQFQVILSDGTKVWLNAASSIRYPAVFSDKERTVEITGEAYFEVAKDASKPFHVKTRTQDVEVLGTHFDVNAYSDEEDIKTTLLEGKVKIVNGKWPVAGGNTPNSQQEVILKPGEQAVCIPYSPLTTNHSPNLEEVMAWKNGYFQFAHADIQTVMRQIARWYDVEIQYEGPVSKDKFGGNIPRDATLSQVLHALEQSLVHFKIQGKKVIVTP